MFNNITSTLLSGDSSEKLIWTLCSVLCGSCLILTIVLQISSLLGHKSLAKYLATSSRYIWYWCIGQLSVYSLACVAGGLSGEREKRCENAHYENARQACVFRPILLAALSVICVLYKQNLQLHRLQFWRNKWKILTASRVTPTPPPPPPPQIEDGKMARFALCAASSLIWSGLGLLFQFILPRLQS